MLPSLKIHLQKFDVALDLEKGETGDDFFDDSDEGGNGRPRSRPTARRQRLLIGLDDRARVGKIPDKTTKGRKVFPIEETNLPRESGCSRRGEKLVSLIGSTKLKILLITRTDGLLSIDNAMFFL